MSKPVPSSSRPVSVCSNQRTWNVSSARIGAMTISREVISVMSYFETVSTMSPFSSTLPRVGMSMVSFCSVRPVMFTRTSATCGRPRRNATAWLSTGKSCQEAFITRLKSRSATASPRQLGSTNPKSATCCSTAADPHVELLLLTRHPCKSALKVPEEMLTSLM
eukprot:Skav233297  [mRNA]  locus=scaffold1501:81994:82590:- [translate_table: standard]